MDKVLDYGRGYARGQRGRIAMNLKRYMEARGLCDAQLAKRLGVSEGAIRKWKYGERIPRAEELQAITRITKGAVTLRDFIHAKKNKSSDTVNG